MRQEQVSAIAIGRGINVAFHRFGGESIAMADLSPKQLRILKVLQSVDGWTTRADMEERAGSKGYSRALGAPMRGIRAGTLEHLGFVERRDKSTPFEYRITETGERALSEYESENGEVQLMR